MAITWTIDQLDRLTADGFVTTAHWRATATDGDYSASVYGTCGWAEGTPTIPYDKLTQNTVLGWVWADGVDKDEIETNLTAQITAQKSPVTETGVPWSTT